MFVTGSAMLSANQYLPLTTKYHYNTYCRTVCNDYEHRPHMSSQRNDSHLTTVNSSPCELGTVQMYRHIPSTTAGSNPYEASEKKAREISTGIMVSVVNVSRPGFKTVSRDCISSSRIMGAIRDASSLRVETKI